MKVKLDDLNQLELYDLFRIRDSLEVIKEYGLADEEMLVEVKRVISSKI